MNKKIKTPRRYNGNPLAYYREHESEYEGMGRFELSLEDSGLYRSLLRAGQLERAITEVGVSTGRKPLSDEKINKIVKLHSPHNGNAHEASKSSPYCSRTILNYWKKEGLKIHRGRFGFVVNDEICALYGPNNGNAYKVAKNSNYPVNTILRHWRKKGLGIKKVGRPRKIKD